MPIKDGKNNMAVCNLHAGEVAATANSTRYVDLGDAQEVTILLTAQVDTASTSGDTLTVTINESDTDPDTPAASASYSVVASTDLIGAFTAIGGGTTGVITPQIVGYKGKQRYLHAVMTEAGTFSGEIHISVIAGSRGKNPTTALTVASLTS